MDAKTYWEQIYQTKEPTQVSWYQDHPEIARRLIRRTKIQLTEPIIDVGGGTSTLVDDLLADGFNSVTVLDLSATALQLARQRLGPQANHVTWIEGDITRVVLPPGAYAVWHDRAVFHFLTNPDDRQQYIECARRSIRSGGHLIVATFALDGPQRCSGLEVVQYSPASLHDEFGQDFELVDSVSEVHHTPSGGEQKFMYCCCRRH